MKKKAGIVFGIVVASLVLAPLVVPVFVPWSPINCWHEDINVKTGQVRETWQLWFITVSEEIVDTPVSEAVQGERIEVAPIEEWHRVNAFSPGVRHSPHYAYHGAIAQIRRLEIIESILQPTPERRREIARGLLSAWQKSGGYFGAEEYLDQLHEEATVCGEHDQQNL